MTQEERVFTHLQIWGTITNAQAHEDYGIRHLPSVIRDIKKNREVVIDEEWAEGINRFNEKCRWKIYKLDRTA